MKPSEIAAIVMLVRRAPFHNMQEAEAAAQLLMKLTQHFAPPPETPVDKNGGPTDLNPS